MRIIAIFTALMFVAVTSEAQTVKPACGPECTAGNKQPVLSCKLTTPELRKRKESVIASLKGKVRSAEELGNGFAYLFDGTDDVVDELISFIKTERQCCDFFVFNLSISGDKSEARLEISGPNGTKDFIKTELGL